MQPHNLTREELLNEVTATPLEDALQAELEETLGELEEAAEELEAERSSFDQRIAELERKLEEVEKENDKLTELLGLV